MVIHLSLVEASFHHQADKRTGRKQQPECTQYKYRYKTCSAVCSSYNTDPGLPSEPQRTETLSQLRINHHSTCDLTLYDPPAAACEHEHTGKTRRAPGDSGTSRNNQH